MLITLSGTMVISCLVNIVQGGGGEILPRFGMLENSPKTVKCVITFETDCSFPQPQTDARLLSQPAHIVQHCLWFFICLLHCALNVLCSFIHFWQNMMWGELSRACYFYVYVVNINFLRISFTVSDPYNTRERERETSGIISAEAWTLDWTSVAGAKLWL